MIESIKLLWNIVLKKYKLRLFMVSLLIWISVICSYLVPIIISWILDYYTWWNYMFKWLTFFWYYILVLWILLLIDTLTYQYWRFLIWVLKVEIPIEFNRYLISDFLDSDINELKNKNLLSFIEIINNASNTLKELLEYYSRRFIRDSIVIFLWTSIVFYIDIYMWLIFLSYIIVITLIHIFYNSKIDDNYNNVVLSNEINFSKIIEWLLNFKTIRYLWLKNNILRNIDNSWNKYIWEAKKVIFYSRVKWFNFSIISSLFLTIWYGYIGYGIFKWFVSAWTIIIFSIYFPRLEDTMDTFLSQLEDFISYKHFILRIKQILNIKKIPNNINIEPNYNFIRFENVDFNYLPNKKVLDNLNFQINPWDKIIVLGKSWSGKSTFLELITWSYLDYKWQIYFNNTELRQINLINHLQRVVYLPQFTELFNDSIRNNVLIAGSKDIDKSFLFSNCNFIYNLSEQLETKIWNKWYTLSWWEIQRIWLARVYMKDSDVYLFDESCSNLDQKNNDIILDNIFQEFKDKIIIYVTHKIQDIDKFNRVLYFKNGSIVYDWKPNMKLIINLQID